ncbi:helix-turn-helix transcriptional regulator [Aequorivita marina]|uniref:helix-turn-helix transcriptional regulator n=1 Tax=Aequorivita marina TaxID=3073654 RepID=UPI0028749690|nr:WYL domain-containing protein [Aequorivita sp. S2608]MDS1297325.1 WYL domain-containing protein [Aequorivita sp. S2608]
MAGYKLLRRIEILIDILLNKPGISKSKLLEILAERHDIIIAERTIERDFQALSNEFRIDVNYSKETNGYSLDTENLERVQQLLKFIELIHIGELFKEGLNDFELLKDKIELEDASKFKGIENLKDILIAIKKRRKIHFTHENYWHKTEKKYTITPLQLKEYLNRWYVVGVPEGYDEIRTFGIDRMENFKIGKVSKVKRKNFEAQLDQFINVVGLNYSAHDKVEKVQLNVNAKQIKYLESLPLHHSQKIEITEDAEFGLVTYYLIPNYEFKVEVLKMNAMVEVLEPKWLRDEIVRMIKEMLGKYE